MFAATDRPTVPFALPLCPDVTEIHGTPLVAVQPQPLIVDTSTLRRPPAAAIESPDRLSEKRHGAAACETSTLCALTVMAPDLGEGTVFAATL